MNISMNEQIINEQICCHCTTQQKKVIFMLNSIYLISGDGTPNIFGIKGCRDQI